MFDIDDFGTGDYSDGDGDSSNKGGPNFEPDPTTITNSVRPQSPTTTTTVTPRSRPDLTIRPNIGGNDDEDEDDNVPTTFSPISPFEPSLPKYPSIYKNPKSQYTSNYYPKKNYTNNLPYYFPLPWARDGIDENDSTVKPWLQDGIEEDTIWNRLFNYFSNLGDGMIV